MFGRDVRTDELRSAAAGAVGLAVLLVGTFLPWLQSGRTTRNSYQTGGEIRRLLATTGIVDGLFVLWPLVAVACAVAVALFLFGLRTLGALVAGLAALGAGAAAVGALAATATSYAQVAIIGPVVTLIGATLVALAVLLRALVAVAVPRSPQ